MHHICLRLGIIYLISHHATRVLLFKYDSNVTSHLVCRLILFLIIEGSGTILALIRLCSDTDQTLF